jgi:DNA-binding response OmpR family regulator
MIGSWHRILFRLLKTESEELLYTRTNSLTKNSLMTSAISKPNIVLVEDNNAELYLFQTALKDSKLQPLINLMVARDGEETLALLERIKGTTDVHLILLDLNLPRIPGKEVLKAIRKLEYLSVTPIIVLSNSDDPRDVQECYELLADRYIQKPGEYIELVKFCSAMRKSILAFGSIEPEFMDREFPEMTRLIQQQRRPA